MTVVRRRWPIKDVDIALRAVLYMSSSSGYFESRHDLCRAAPGDLAPMLEGEGDYIVEYTDPSTGQWMSIGGWRAPSFGVLQLTAAEVRNVAGSVARYGENAVWIAYDNRPEDVLEAMVLAGWVPSARGLELAAAARRYLDQRCTEARS